MLNAAKRAWKPWALVAAIAAVFVALPGGGPAPSFDGVLLADPGTAYLVASVGLSILAGLLLKPDTESPIDTDKPTTLSTRGSFVPWFVGIRRVAPVFCWAGDREVRKEKVEGAGKGLGGSPEQDVVYESGWHALGIGPCHALYSIVQGGKTVFTGPITSESHPSGTLVSAGKEGDFYIYWGEDSQPVNSFLGASSRVSINSRWPGLCYVVWNRKRLGTSPNWPILQYVMERRPSNSLLTQSDGWYEPEFTATAKFFDVYDFNASANEDIGYLEFEGDRTVAFRPGYVFNLSGNALPDGLYTVLRIDVVFETLGTNWQGFPIQEPRTRVFLEGGTAGADDAGTANPYEPDTTDGANIAHVIAELLFADWPAGLQLDPGHRVEQWDLNTLEELGVEAESEEWRASVLGNNGEKADALLGTMLQDHGTMLPLDLTSGAMVFRRVRFPSGTLPALGDGIYANREPEIESVVGEQPVDRMIFEFEDRDNNHAKMTIQVDEDGQASFLEHQRARKIPIKSTTLFSTAAALSELRSPEELAQSVEITLEAGREARDLVPGVAITASGFDEVLRVLSVEIDPLSESVKIRCMPDYYGAPKSDFVTNQGGGPDDIQDPEPDVQFAWVELPEQVLGSFPSTQAVLVPRIRAHTQISFSAIWLSRDNSTYTLFGNDTAVQTGGTLDDSLDADGPTYMAQGPEYSEEGPDNGTLTQDLSADLTNWGLGRQLAIIVSSVGIEVCFVQQASITGASTRRLDGLLRARYDTRKLSHPAGAEVYIVDRDSFTAIQDVLLEPEEDLYVKSQPGTTSGQVNLSAVPPYAGTLYGKGQVPVQPDYVQARAPHLNSPSFQTGDDVTVSWALSTGTPGTGAGGQSAGTAIAAPDIPGTVQVEYLTTGDVVQLTRGLAASSTEDTITNAELVAAFGSEPTAFKVRVTHIANGHSSPASPALTITRV